jgi:hypothetical protein
VSNSHTGMSPLAVWLGPRTAGYAFAYFAFVRGDQKRRLAANERGSTFYYYFASMNPLTDEKDVAKCDVCDKRPGVRRVTAYGSDTWVCEKCGGEE